MNKIEGMPDGWELVRIDVPKIGEWVISSFGHPNQLNSQHTTVWTIIRKIEKPKQYGPFKNAGEFAPHRDRWIRRLANGGAFLVHDYSDKGVCYNESNPVSWKELFNMGYVFDNLDGTTEPFGVEVQS